MPRMPTAAVIAGVFFAQAFALLALIHFTPPGVVFFVGPLAGIVGALACLAARRARFLKPASEEPWALNAWGSLLAGAALPMLGWSVGTEAAAMGWLLAALLVGLGTMAIASKPPAS